jgi:hypothetical protein
MVITNEKPKSVGHKMWSSLMQSVTDVVISDADPRKTTKNNK